MENAHIGSVLPPTAGTNPPDICSGYGRMQWGKSGSTQGTVGKSIWNSTLIGVTTSLGAGHTCLVMALSRLGSM